MSRNFELLTQLECEPDVRDKRHVSGAAREAVKAFTVPTSIDTGQDEMLQLVQRVFLSADGKVPHAVVFCGVDAEGGSSTVCAHAGRALAANSLERICLVDANPFSSGLLGFFRASPVPREAGNRADDDHSVQVASNLWLTTLYPTTSTGAAVSATEMQSKLTQLRLDFAYVLIDAPGCSLNTGATFLGQHSDAVILVVEAEETRRVTARKAKQNFEAAGIRLLGTVLHNRTFPIPKSLYKRL